jgi:GDP-L-fucose synthase
VKAIVLGATGLVGSAIERRLRANGDIVFTFPGLDLRSAQDFLKLDFQADAIFHAVECLKGISAQGVPDPEQVADNVLCDVNIVRGWRAYQPTARLVAFSSLWAYPAVGEIFYPHEFRLGPQPTATAQYGDAKRLLVSRITGLRATVLTLGNVYGPGDRSFRIVPTVLKTLLRQGDLVIKTDGAERRNFVYVDDVAAAAIEVVDREVSGIQHVVDGPSTLRELVATARHVVKHAGKVSYGINAGTTRLLRRCGLEVEYTSLEDGLRRTVESMKATETVGVFTRAFGNA